MRASAAIPVLAGCGLLLSLAIPSIVSAQAPTRLAPPPRTGVIQQAEPPAGTAVVAQPPGQPTTATDTAPTPAPVTQVSGPTGVTQLGAPPGASTGSSQPATASSSQAVTGSSRSYAAAKFALTLEGIQAGWLGGFEGGTPTGEVVVEKAGPDNVIHKHLGGVKYEDMVIKTGLENKALLSWVADALAGKSSAKNGSVIFADYDQKATGEREFVHGRLNQVTFPALDGSSKEAGHLLVSIVPEYTRLKGGSGTTVGLGSPGKQDKRWSLQNFRFEMNGLDGSRVSRIESFTVGQKLQENAVGEQRDYEKAPGAFEISNLTVTLLASTGQTWNSWFDDFVVQGRNGQEQERSGAIIYLDQSRTVELGRINLFDCGIFRLSPTKKETNTEAISRLEAGLYCERMQFVPKATP